MGSHYYQTRKNCFAHWAHTLEIVAVVTYKSTPCVPHRKSMHFMRHSCFVRFKLFRELPTFFCPASALVCVVRFFLKNLAEFSACSWLGQVLLQYLARITLKSSAQKSSTSIKKIPQISVQLAYKFVPKFLQQVDVMSEVFGPWSGINCLLPLTSHARVCVQAD